MPLEQSTLTARVGQILVQAENFRKKFRSLPIPHLRVPLKHAAPLPSSGFWGQLATFMKKFQLFRNGLISRLDSKDHRPRTARGIRCQLT
jgi:hypothetical protein